MTEARDFDGSELDFWIGTWDVSWAGGGGTNRIERILGGRVIHERFEESGSDTNLHGQSWSVFDADGGLWRQVWVDDQGSFLDLVGGRVDGWFALTRAAPERGPAVHQRMVFRDVAPAGFRWTWELSQDDGARWAVRWEIAYRRLA